MTVRYWVGVLLLAADFARPAVLMEHDYDALGDRVTATAVHAREHVTQSFTAPEGTSSAAAVRLKIRRNGGTGPLGYRIGTTLGGSELGAGEIPPENVQPFFEHFVSLRLKQPKIQPGHKYYVQVRLDTPSDGYYDVFGTSKGEESPSNLDYGATTPEYAGGEAYDTADHPIPGVDFAFQLIGPGPDSARAEEPFTFIGPLIEPVRYRRARHAASPRSRPGEVLLDGSWSIDVPPTSGEVVRIAATEFARFMKEEMGVALAPAGAHRIVVRTGPAGPAPANSEAFSLHVRADRITISGAGERGMMRGLYYLQDVLDLRQAPLVAAGIVTRTPRYNPRITCAPFSAGMELDAYGDPYTEALLSKMSHAGYNAIWVWVKIYQVGISAIFPELGGESAARQARLRAITDRAAKYGMDAYAYVTIDPLPAAFFTHHPAARGVARAFNAFYGSPGYVLCPSSREVQRYLEQATASIFRGVPRLRGAMMIPFGEGLYTCRTHEPSTCPRCANRTLDAVLADLVTAIQRGALEGNSKAEVATWTYTWPASDPSRAALIARLPKNMIWLNTFDKEGIIERDGVQDHAYDYSISYLGPSENLMLQLPLIEKAGLRFWVKTESMISQEFIQSPYIPVYQRWEERYRRIARLPHVSGLFLNWNHYGFVPSRVSELVKWFTWDPMPRGDDVLRRMAERDFGAAAASGFVDAWRALSAAYDEFPFSDGTTRNGPLPKGPAHPFFWDPAYVPHFHARRQFFNNLEWTQPWDVEIAAKYFKVVENAWAKGTEMLHRAANLVDPEHRDDAERGVGIAEVQLSCFRSILHLIRFYQLRFDLARAAAPQPILKEMAAVLRAERANSLHALPYVERDSRLGYANGGNGITNGGVRAGIFTAASIRKKLAHLDRVLEKDLPAYRGGQP